MIDLRALGKALRSCGLLPHVLGRWAGTTRLAALPARLPRIRRERWRPTIALELFARGATVPHDEARAPRGAPVAPGPGDEVRAAGDDPAVRRGATVPGDEVRAAGDDRAPRARGWGLPVDELIAAGLLERADGGLRARVAVLPLGEALVVCDRDDAPATATTVCWPDDSSYHLASAIPAGRRDRWLDLACGSAFAALARPGLGTRIRCEELNPRAVELARLGLALSGIAHAEVAEADVGAIDPAGDRADLITCNAPIPDEPARWHRADAPLEPTLWRSTDRGFFARLWRAVPARLAPDPAALAVIHCALDAIPPDLPGERTIVQYTPPGPRAFAVLWWRPHGESRLRTAARMLTVERPHLDATDLDDARAGALC